MEQFIKLNFDNYFNSILKDSVGYPETFSINVNLDNREIILTSNDGSELIELLEIDDKFYNELSGQVLSTLQKFNPDIGIVTMNLVNNSKIIINYQVTFETLGQIDINANIAANLSLNEIENLCDHNRSFKESCNNPRFWVEVLRNKYGDIPKEIKNVDYKQLLQEVETYVNDMNRGVRTNIRELNKNLAIYLLANKIADKTDALMISIKYPPHIDAVMGNFLKNYDISKKYLLNAIENKLLFYSDIRMLMVSKSQYKLDADVVGAIVNSYYMDMIRNRNFLERMINLLDEALDKRDRLEMDANEEQKWLDIIDRARQV